MRDILILLWYADSVSYTHLKGIGNGLSLLIFSSIVSNWSSLYTTVAGLLTRAAAGESQF